MAIPDNAIIEDYAKIDKCIIHGTILDIQPTSIDGCITTLKITAQSNSGYYIIRGLTTTQKNSTECSVTSEYNGDSYKNDIGKEKKLLIGKESNGMYIDSGDTKDSTQKIVPGYRLITPYEYDNYIDNFPGTEDCIPNSTGSLQTNINTSTLTETGSINSPINTELLTSNTAYLWVLFSIFALGLGILIGKKIQRKKE